ncbi:MAG TPA: class II aldolase/adducin family protein [Geminicoccaceae bacterium]|nr:class II aldolase/adducin family protein [Geminicoccaceae bacterium]
MQDEERALREAIVGYCREMNATGLNQGTSGNISARSGGWMLVTPSGVPYETMRPEDIARMPVAGEYGTWEGPLTPSTEWRFHLDIMRERPEVGAIVHTHSTYATTLAICRREIPACHYMIAAAGGPSIRVASYATYGTKELSLNVLEAMRDRTCCLLANHGMIATGPSLMKAMWLAVELETIARQYYLALAMGGPVLLPDAEIAKVVEAFANYGPRKQVGRASAVHNPFADLKPQPAKGRKAKQVA